MILRCATPGCDRDWVRCSPGQSADALPYPPDSEQRVLAFPGADVPTVAWCLVCKPVGARNPR